MKIMSYVAPEVVQEVKRMDLLTYLKTHNPYELIHLSGNTYTTREHDSLKISNGKWMWWSRGIGGRSALDYLIKVKGYSFLEAVEMIAGQTAIQPSVSSFHENKTEKNLLLPQTYRYTEYVVSYLRRRGIDMEIIEFCLKTRRLYESADYHNAVFVGWDKGGKARYAALRGVGTDFVGEANGSDKNYSFSIPAEGESKEVHLFESAIDLLSYATLQKMRGGNWREEHLLSLAGVYQPAKEIEQSKVPATLTRFLKEYPIIESIVLHFDNDRIGRLVTKAMQTVLPKQYQIRDEPPLKGKDYNDFLCLKLGLQITKRENKNPERGELR